MSEKKKTASGAKGIGETCIYDARSLGAPKVLVLGVQHMFAMFGATILVPMLTGLDVSTTLLFAGLGTLLFHFLTKGKVPAFLGSSFAFLGGYATIAPLADASGNAMDNSGLLPYACFGVACAGLVYLLLSLLIRLFGTGKVMRFFPPIVTGPIIIAIGLTLSQSAIDNCSSDWLIAIVAIALVIVCNIWGKGMVKIVPIIIGVIGSYVLAGILGRVDFTAVKEAGWIGLPVHWNQTAFWALSDGDVSLLITSVITIMPIALATIVEHIGDVSAISSTVEKNFIKDPGLHRTLLGDGLATIMAALFGAPANTTYGENTGVLALTKVYDPLVVRMAALFAILFSFSPKFAAVIGCMPTATCGGVSLVLYGMISAVGVRNIVETRVDFAKSRNVIIAALILVLSIGINYSAAGSVGFTVGDLSISFSGIAVGALTGIILNAILPGKDYKFDDDKPDGTGVDFAVRGR
ncbi:uracil-xanthine permease family protein [Acetatifactor aquisgranensis]|uniref:uracil-xanthine permease family protein n=1 Tax=Acetatifactor aquisgranensis TaxID=2941233 RepID=UPI0020414ACC|nr:uracil-xanthine permease family protein [Acetatifactor aquisgranensis]MCI8543628.1 uracil-xanthine permease [Lachnospiraceae bacterium]